MLIALLVVASSSTPAIPSRYAVCMLTDHPLPACNGTIVNDTEMGEVIQLQGDQRKDVQEFLVDKKDGLELDAKTIKVRLLPYFTLTFPSCMSLTMTTI